jgi:carbonic anhydrase
VRQSLRRIEASPFVTKHESLHGFIFDVATGRLNEVRHVNSTTAAHTTKTSAGQAVPRQRTPRFG